MGINWYFYGRGVIQIFMIKVQTSLVCDLTRHPSIISSVCDGKRKHFNKAKGSTMKVYSNERLRLPKHSPQSGSNPTSFLSLFQFLHNLSENHMKWGYFNLSVVIRSWNINNFLTIIRNAINWYTRNQYIIHVYIQ